MKNILKITLQLILSIIYIIIALLLFKYLLIPSIIIALFLSFFKNKIKNGFLNIIQYLRSISYSIDQLGNVTASYMFNLILIKKGGITFGNPDETISSVLGKNLKINKLSSIGKILNWILNKLEKGHSLLSIEKDEKSGIKK